MAILIYNRSGNAAEQMLSGTKSLMDSLPWMKKVLKGGWKNHYTHWFTILETNEIIVIIIIVIIIIIIIVIIIFIVINILVFIILIIIIMFIIKIVSSIIAMLKFP